NGADGPDAIPLPQPTYWFKLDEVGGGTAYDSSGHSANGTLNQLHVKWQPTGGVVNGAAHLDGTAGQSCIFFPSPCAGAPYFGSAITAGGWVKFDTFGTAAYSLGDFAIAQGTSGGTGGGWGVGASDICGGQALAVTVTPATSSTDRIVRCS